MTVQELITALAKLDPKLPVYVNMYASHKAVDYSVPPQVCADVEVVNSKLECIEYVSIGCNAYSKDSTVMGNIRF